MVEKWVLTDFANEVKGNPTLVRGMTAADRGFVSIGFLLIQPEVSMAVTGRRSRRSARRSFSPLSTAGAT